MDNYDIAYRKANEIMKQKLSEIKEPMHGTIRDCIADGIVWAISHNDKIQALIELDRLKTDA